MKILFFGTPDFAVPCLEALIKNDFEIVGVITKPDAKKNRGQRLFPSPVKEKALELGLDVFTPDSMKSSETLELIKELNPDINVVVAFGKILPKEILFLPKYNSINIHGSILPKYRGAAPVQRAVINGEKRTGITSMLMDEGLDTGDMLLTESTEIGENETAGELFERLSFMGAQLLLNTLDSIIKNNVCKIPQNNAESTYANMINKDMCKLDFSKSSFEIHNLVRGLNPKPSAFAELSGVRYKIHKTVKTAEKTTLACGTVQIEKDRLKVACGDGLFLEIIEIQAPGKNKMAASDFLRGVKLTNGALFA